VNSFPTVKLSSIEKEIVAEIRGLRASPNVGLHAALLESPARLARHFILATHGNVQLRFRIIAKELGVEMRTLERLFVTDYQRTMMQFQVEVRLNFSKHLLSVFPPTKISAIAANLGYDVVQDFNRFFKKHMHEPPSEWSCRERERIAREASRDPRH
jgi:transcriptional regulator GlxA family with amidase domain